MKWLLSFLLLLMLAACKSVVVSPAVFILPSPGVRRALIIVTPFPSPTRAPTLTPFPTFQGIVLPTPQDIYSQYTIQALRSRNYGGGRIESLGVLSQNDKFSRYSIRYPSDGLSIAGYVNVPKGEGPFPVIIVLHGYANPTEYDILDYTTGVTDELASQGYLVIHPNYRNFRPSDSGDVLFRAGYAIDVLNLIALLQENSGKPGLFEHANSDRIGLWGHSLGGGIALKVGVISSSIKAILLYAPMSGDEQKNSQFFNFMTGNKENQKELMAGPHSFDLISPDNYYGDIKAAIQLHHGTGDTIIPIAWAEETCQRLKDAKRQVECYYYDGAEHTFRARFLGEYGTRVDSFFSTYLKK